MTPFLTVCPIRVTKAVAFAGLWLVATNAAAVPKSPEKLDRFLEQHCFECHDDVTSKGNLNLLDTAIDFSDPESFATWVKVHDRVQKGEMPPEKKPRPDGEERDRLIAALSTDLLDADRARQEKEGRVRFRRLNRVEYEHTLQDLLGLPALQIKEMLPPDAEAHGFDNVGDALRVSYVQMARYLKAAEAALDEAAWLAPKPERYRFRQPFIDMHRFRTTNDRTTVGSEAVLLRQPNTAQTPWRLDTVQIPFPGTHTIRIRGRAVTYHQDEAVPADYNRHKEGRVYDHGELLPPKGPQIVSLYQGTRLLGSFELGSEPTTSVIKAHLYSAGTAGESDAHRLILSVPTLRDWNPAWTKGAYEGPAVALDWLEVEGPDENAFPTASYRALFDELPVRAWDAEKDAERCDPPPVFGELKHPKRWPKLDFPKRDTRFMVVSENPEADARRLLRRFVDRAFRRPVPDTEVERYLTLVKHSLEAKKPFHLAMIDGYRGVLTSPDFLYNFEQPGRLDDYALASRLSYFFWRSMPDRELIDLADKGQLADAGVLKQQVNRMLADPRSERFINDFAGQWLTLREIRATQPDKKLYPEFDDFLLESMVAETRRFVREMVEANLPARSVVTSDFVFANNVLSELYDLDPIEGVDLQKVPLPKGSVRGGLLTQASLLKVTANGTTTSPVMRGAWVLEHLLGQPAPPPPPDVPAIEPDTRGATTVRELLAKHRADPACASCHTMIDPPGFALESFDVIGGWRERYRSLELGDKVEAIVDSRPVSYKQGLKVDSTGKMPSGVPFEDIHGFRQAILQDERQLARNLAERLTVFATGAGISFADRVEIEAILEDTAENQYGVRDLIHAIVQSELFLSK